MYCIDTGAANGKLKALVDKYQGKQIARPKSLSAVPEGMALIVVETFERYQRAAFIRTREDWKTINEFPIPGSIKPAYKQFVLIPRAIALRESGITDAVMKDSSIAWAHEKVNLVLTKRKK